MIAHPGLCRTRSETPKAGFLTTRLISSMHFSCLVKTELYFFLHTMFSTFRTDRIWSFDSYHATWILYLQTYCKNKYSSGLSYVCYYVVLAHILIAIFISVLNYCISVSLYAVCGTQKGYFFCKICPPEKVMHIIIYQGVVSVSNPKSDRG